uniref:Uncharacterized protein n=1 Tax=Romanomermis culicivorax TaxID=13658 RepID=A0A915JVQ3_ROMCU
MVNQEKYVQHTCTISLIIEATYCLFPKSRSSFRITVFGETNLEDPGNAVKRLECGRGMDLPRCLNSSGVALTLPVPSAAVEENPDENCVAVQPIFRHRRCHPSTTYAVWQTTSSPAL